MPLQLHVDIGRPKDLNQSLHFIFGCVITAARKGCSQWPFGATGQTDEPLGVGLELFQSRAPFPFGFLPQLVLRDKPAQVPVAFGSLRQQ